MENEGNEKEGTEGASPPLPFSLDDLGEPMSQPSPHSPQVSRDLRKERKGWSLRMGDESLGNTAGGF